MRRAQRVLILALTLATARDLTGQAREETTLAMLDFDLSGVEGSSEEVGTLLAELVAIELSRASSLRVLERERLVDLLREQTLQLSGETDARRTLSSGRMLGARFLVSGSAFSVSGKVTVTVNLTSTDTGLVQGVVHESEAGATLSETARSLAVKIREALGDRKVFQVTDGRQEGPSGAFVSTGDQRPTGVRRVRVFLEETLLGERSGSSVAEDELSYLLARKSFHVFAIAGEGAGTLPLNVVDLDDSLLASNLKDVDALMVGEARAVPGRRTGDLVSAQAELKLRVYGARARREIQTIHVRSRAFDVSAEAAARSALRRVASEALKRVLPGLAELETRDEQ